MEKKSTSRKNKTIFTHLTWLGVLAASIILFATCYEWALIGQPTEATSNSSIDVPIVIKQDGEGDFAHDLDDLGCFGVLLPDGWTVDDSIEYSVKGVYQNEPVGPYNDTGWVIHSMDQSQMYEDSVGPAPEGYYWWGGLSSDTAHVDNLDSISLTITINVGDTTGEFTITYAFGTLDFWERNPVALISDPMDLTVTAPTNVARYLEGEISVYPNPVSDILSVNVGGITHGEIRLYDIAGRLQMERTINSKVNRFDISQYPSGPYILKVRTDQGDYTQKILLRK
jgi:hypothetical protein